MLLFAAVVAAVDVSDVFVAAYVVAAAVVDVAPSRICTPLDVAAAVVVVVVYDFSRNAARHSRQQFPPPPI